MTSPTPMTSAQDGVRQRTIAGLALIAIGAFALAGFAVPDLSRFTLIAVSVVSILGFALTRDYGFGVTAGIAGGIGAMIAIVSTGTFDPSLVATTVFLSLAGGFAATWVLGLLALPRETNPWPLVPAAIFATFAVGLAIGQPAIFDLVNALFVGSLVVVGAAMALRRRQA